MGEARRRRATTPPTVYHHTSTLRTNLIWMSGLIEVEGKSEGVFHPQLGEIKTDALARRSMTDFPPVAWFTTNINVPHVLTNARFFTQDKVTGRKKGIDIGSGVANAIALNRVALGFRIADIPVVPWPEYRGYDTPEGRELNSSALEMGDNPNEWYVSETAVDVLRIAEFWHSTSILNPKLTRLDSYIEDIRRMVTTVREAGPGAYIPPSWMTLEQASALAKHIGVEILNQRDA